MEYDITVSDEEYLFVLLSTTFNAIMSARKKELEFSGVSMTRSEVLWALGVMGGPTAVADIARTMGRDYQTTSQLLNRMEKEGLVARRNRSSKRSPLVFMLTPSGDEALRRTLERNEVVTEIMACLSPDERDVLAACLEKVREKAVAKGALYSPFPAPIASKLRM